jgi:peptide/nickel transport system permease protein
MGATMLFAAQNKDLPMLTTGVLIIGIVYMLATLAADITMAWMNPRIRLDTSS